MTFTPITWTDGTTPVDASNLNRIETGLSNAADEINSALVRITTSVSSNSSTRFIYSEGQTIGTPSACLVIVGGQATARYGAYLVNSYGYSSTRSHISDLGSGSNITCETLDDDWGFVVSNTSSSSANIVLVVLMGNTPTISRA